MTTPELLQFIRTQLTAGQSRDAITQALLTAGGWSFENINEGFAIVEVSGVTSRADPMPPTLIPTDTPPPDLTMQGPAVVGPVDMPAPVTNTPASTPVPAPVQMPAPVINPVPVPSAIPVPAPQPQPTAQVNPAPVAMPAQAPVSAPVQMPAPVPAPAAAPIVQPQPMVQTMPQPLQQSAPNMQTQATQKTGGSWIIVLFGIVVVLVALGLIAFTVLHFVWPLKLTT